MRATEQFFTVLLFAFQGSITVILLDKSYGAVFYCVVVCIPGFDNQCFEINDLCKVEFGVVAIDSLLSASIYKVISLRSVCFSIVLCVVLGHTLITAARSYTYTHVSIFDNYFVFIESRIAIKQTKQD